MYFPVRSRLYSFPLAGSRRCYQLFDINLYLLHLLIHLDNSNGQHYRTIAPCIRISRKPEMRKMSPQQSVFTIILHINGHFCKCTQPSTEKITAIQPADVAHNSRYIFYTIHLHGKRITAYHPFRFQFHHHNRFAFCYFHIIQRHNVEIIRRPNHILSCIYPNTPFRICSDSAIALIAFYADTFRIIVVNYHCIIAGRYFHFPAGSRQIAVHFPPLGIFRIKYYPHGLRQILRNSRPVQRYLYATDRIIVQHLPEITS